MRIQRVLSKLISINIEKNRKPTISHPLHSIASRLMPVTRRGVILTMRYCVGF